MITGAQVRHSRALLRWSSAKLAAASGLDIGTVLQSQIDVGARNLTEVETAALRKAFEAAGIEFTSNGEPGVRLKKGSST